MIDRALRDANFNFSDAVIDSDAQWLRSRVTYELSDAVTLSNELSDYHSDRRFINAESYASAPRATW